MANIKLKKRKATTIAYIDHVGAYDKIPWNDYIEKLYGWAKQNKAKPGFPPTGIYFDEMGKVPAEKCRSQAAIPIRKSVPASGGVKVRELPEMEVAVIKHAGSGEDFKNTYAELHKWLEQNGYLWSGPCMELYNKAPKVKDGKAIIYCQVQVPVKKK
jgi:DNA gyrase inhibitor GyrI